jgi:hypothetical protein
MWFVGILVEETQMGARFYPRNFGAWEELVPEDWKEVLASDFGNRKSYFRSSRLTASSIVS